MTLSADSHWGGVDLRLVKAPEYFDGLGFYLLFFAANKRQNVIDDVERRNARIARTGKRLKRRGHACFHPKRRMQRGQGKRNHYGGTVWVGNNEPTLRILVALLLKQSDVLVIHFRNQ